MTGAAVKPKGHPAKFSAPILERIGQILEPTRRAEDARPVRLLDPFAGVGLIHQLASTEIQTWGIEIEPEWAAQHPRTIIGDATRLPFPAGSFDIVATSPTYGNRMADRYDGQGRCKACAGNGLVFDVGVVPMDCERCAGTGRDQSKRYTYRLSLGRRLHPRNTGGMRWGPAYWHTHWSAWIEVRRVLVPEGMLILNVSDSVRLKAPVRVVAWHRARLEELGFVVLADDEISTRRMGHGANRDARAETEHVITFQAPPEPKETS